MEISIYQSLDARRNGKALYRFRVACPDCFPFDKFFEVFRALLGSDIVIEILKV